MKWRPVLYPFLLGAYPILALYANNARQARPSDLWAPITLIVIAALVLWSALAFVLRDVHRAGAVTALAVVLFTSIEQATPTVNLVLEALSGYWVRQSFRLWPPLIMTLQAVLFTALAYLVITRLKNPRGWTKVLNVFALILVTLPTITILGARSEALDEIDPPYPTLASLPPSERRPDIYYIILDSFARSDVLRTLFDYDLEPFLARLERRGFYVARQATSNYCQTPLSLTSSLNGVHLADRGADESAGRIPPQEFYRRNAVFASLRPLGYRFVSFASGFDFTEYPNADFYLSPYRFLSNFHRLLLEQTPLSRWLPNPMEHNSYTMTRNRTQYVARMLPEIARIGGPTFTVAHILSPHPPFVFGENGEDVSPHHLRYYLSDGNLFRGHYGDADVYIPGYRGQIPYLVRLVEAAIDGILANSPEPPIIVLQSDHGSGLNLHMGSAEATDHWERMSILNAYYVPQAVKAKLYPQISPVNTFRLIFNQVFGANLELLPDESYYSTWYEPFRFYRVTDQTRR